MEIEIPKHRWYQLTRPGTALDLLMRAGLLWPRDWGERCYVEPSLQLLNLFRRTPEPEGLLDALTAFVRAKGKEQMWDAKLRLHDLGMSYAGMGIMHEFLVDAIPEMLRAKEGV